MTRAATNRYLLLAILLLILTSNYLDRAVLSLALQDIKRELVLSDTQLGLMTGLAFAVFYSVMGVPIARWADRGDRIWIITVTTALWSVLAALCGMARSFWELILIRVGVGVGEAGCIPPAHSLIGDHFGRTERPRALSIYMMGAPLAIVIGYFAGGWLIEHHGWRQAFLLLSVPGLALALMARLILRDPRRSVTEPVARAEMAAAPVALGSALAALLGNRTFVHLLLANAILSFFGQGIWQWQPAFFIRTHHLPLGEIGMWFALSAGVGGIVGTLLGGELAARLAASNESLQLRGMALAYIAFGAISASVYLVSDPYVAFGLIGLAAAGGSIAIGPSFSAIQAVVPGQLRATSIALVYLFANLIGMGLGPVAAGVLSDVLRTVAGEESLRLALMLLCPGYGWAAWHMWRASRSVAGDLAASENVAPAAP